MKSKVYIPSDKEFIEIVKNSNSGSDVLRKLGLKTSGGSSRTVLKRRLKELKCDTSHFGRKNGQSLQAKYTMKEILVENSSYANIARLKERLVKENVLEYKCNICGINSWNNKELSLQLDHINGVNNDHRLENIRFLCPNCHSQTDTYAGKNIK